MKIQLFQPSFTPSTEIDSLKNIIFRCNSRGKNLISEKLTNLELEPSQGSKDQQSKNFYHIPDRENSFPLLDCYDATLLGNDVVRKANFDTNDLI
jgi:hypothetical protein